MKFGLSILAVSFACFVNAAFAATISATYRPSGSESGYVVSIPFEYNMRECFNDLHIGIKRGQASSPTEYVYKGKSYSAADLGLNGFSNVQVMGVNLTVDVHDRAMRAGEVRMTNVIPQGGSGCYGQSYSVQKSISGFDGKAASKRAGDFNLQNARVQATTIDAAIEAKIRALDADATKAAASGAATAAATGAAVNETTGDKASPAGATANVSTNTQAKPS